MGQLAKQMAHQHGGSFPSNTQVNPKEQCKAIVAKSGKEVGLTDEENNGDEGEMIKKREFSERKLNEEARIEEEKIKIKIKKKKIEKKKKKKRSLESPLVRNIPYPIQLQGRT